MLKQIPAYAILGTALLAPPAATNAAPATAPVSNPLSTARTIQVRETMLKPGSDGNLSQQFDIAVSIERPKKVRVAVSTAASPAPDLYVNDGDAEYEYDNKTNSYRLDTPGTDGKSQAVIRKITQVDLILEHGGEFPSMDGMKRDVTSETLDGKPMQLITSTVPFVKSADKEVDVIVKEWIDTASSLPYRLSTAYATKDKTQPIYQVTFHDWKVNQPIPAAQLAWAAPAGARLVHSDDEANLLAAGSPAPDFSAITPDGKTVKLSDYKGKTVVLDFWATWCGPCQKSMPHLESVYKQVKGQDVVVLGVCVWDQKDAYDKWVAKKAGMFTFQTAFDPAGHGDNSIAGKLYHVKGIPTQYIIDKDGKIAAGYSGYNDGETRLDKALAKLGVTLPGEKTASAKP